MHRSILKGRSREIVQRVYSPVALGAVILTTIRLPMASRLPRKPGIGRSTAARARTRATVEVRRPQERRLPRRGGVWHVTTIRTPARRGTPVTLRKLTTKPPVTTRPLSLASVRECSRSVSRHPSPLRSRADAFSRGQRSSGSARPSPSVSAHPWKAATPRWSGHLSSTSGMLSASRSGHPANSTPPLAAGHRSSGSAMLSPSPSGSP